MALLESPFELAGRRLRNRIVHASMTTRRAANASVTEAQIQYYANRARGGAAMIVTEPLTWSSMHDVEGKTRAWNNDNLDGLKRWAAAVEAHDCRLLAQVQDPGPARHDTQRNCDAMAPSALADDLSWSMPRAMTREQIHRFTADVAQSAARLKRCGFSGIELSAGHGHLFHQFLSPRSNRRDDEDGGSWPARPRFIPEIVSAGARACGRAFLIGLKLARATGMPARIRAAQAAIIPPLLTASGEANYVCF